MKMIPVTKPFMPKFEEYEKYLKQIWESGWLTNMGPLSQELERRLSQYLDVENLLFVSNGTIALQMAIKALNLKGEIITTPFSFVATTSTIAWEGCTPVFVDIDKDSLNIDPTKIEDAITEKTSAILATHVYGNPCDVIGIEEIAKKHNLKVIYDGAHAFGVKLNGKSIFEYGDISTCSLHATKLYHSIEGGLIITKDSKLSERLKHIRNFGISGNESFSELGINGKNSEFHAAMGLVNIDHIDLIFERRERLSRYYDEFLKGLELCIPLWNNNATKNYAYYPVLFKNEETLLQVKNELEKNNIYGRRYFYPSLSNGLPYLKKILKPISENISKKTLCLPLYADLKMEDQNLICEIIKKYKVVGKD